jgi:hypothetical protein
MVSPRPKHISEEDIAVLQKPSGYVLNSGTPPTIILSACGKKLMAKTVGTEEKSFENNVARSDGMASDSDEPDRKKVKLDVTLKSQNDVDGCVTPDVQATQSSSGTLSVESGNDATSNLFQNSLLHRKVHDVPLNSSLQTSEAEIPHNYKALRSMNIAVRGLPGVTNYQASNKPIKCGTDISNEKKRKSVYDIIVEHNVAAQVRRPQSVRKMVMKGIGGNENKAAPMVYFPESNLSNTPKNINTSEIAAKMTEGFMRQAYEDWVRCGIPDESGNM